MKDVFIKFPILIFTEKLFFKPEYLESFFYVLTHLFIAQLYVFILIIYIFKIISVKHLNNVPNTFHMYFLQQMSFSDKYILSTVIID